MKRFHSKIDNSKIHIMAEHEDSRRCRICFDTTGPLLSPCTCKGSMQFVHNDCLVQWMMVYNEAKGQNHNQGNTFRCDVCNSSMAYTSVPQKTDHNKWHALLMSVTATTLFMMIILCACAMSGFFIGSVTTTGTIRFLKPIITRLPQKEPACSVEEFTQTGFSSNHSLLVYSETWGRCINIRSCDVMSRDCKVAFRQISLQTNKRKPFKSLTDVSSRWTTYWRMRLDIRAHKFQNLYVLSDFIFLGLIFFCIGLCILQARNSEYTIVLGMELVQLFCVFIGMGYITVFDEFNMHSTSIMMLPLQNWRYLPLFLVVLCTLILPSIMFIHVYMSLCTMVYRSFMYPGRMTWWEYQCMDGYLRKTYGPTIHFESVTQAAKS
jgi:hypothetical protein